MSQFESLDAADGSALTWIFDHCLRYADSYEISLRAAYELNCSTAKNLPAMGGSSAFARTRSPSLFSQHSSLSKNTKSTRSSGSSYDAGYDTNAEFRACLTRTVSELPSQPCSLPPSFIVSFVRRCFCLELHNVDFAQALTALDYLKDLQGRWKKEIDSAFLRLNVTAQDARDPRNSEVARKYPGVMEWYTEVSQKARMIDFMFIINYEANPGILKPVMAQGARAGEENGWPALYDVFNRYLNLVLEVIDECALINEPAHVDKSGHSRRTDSGISFGPSLPSRPTTAHSSDTEKPLPEFPAPSSDGSNKHGSVLERVAYSISSWGKNGKKARNLKKMQSCKELNSERIKMPTDFSKMSFDLTEQKRRRLIDEALARKAVVEHEIDVKTIGQAF
ncbi:unnamed protein product [Penicillium bialowiezense]